MKDIKSYYVSLRGKKVFFLGAGISNKQLILKYASFGADVTLCDAKEETQLQEYLKDFLGIDLHLILGKEYLSRLNEADIIFRTPGIDYTKPEIQQALKNGKTVTSEIEEFFRWCPSRIIGITGSDGKTTTTSLIAAALKDAGYTVHLGGNIGRPLFPVIDEVGPEDIAVVELSSFQLISMAQSPDIAVVTNVTPNHLDHHKDMREYINAKRNILLYQNEDGVAVLNIENDVTRGMEEDVKGGLREFGRCPVKSGVCIKDNTLVAVKDGVEKEIMDFRGIALRGEHNRENIAAAYCAVMTLIDDETFRKTAISFPGVEHRIEFVREKDGVSWFNDSIATSPTRTIAGLRSFDEKMILIAGGSDKGLDYLPLAPDIVKHVKLLLLSGTTAEKIERAVLECSAVLPEIVRTNNVADSVKIAAERAERGDIVLLSPASPSFDSYNNFEERGRHFKQLVNAL